MLLVLGLAGEVCSLRTEPAVSSVSADIGMNGTASVERFCVCRGGGGGGDKSSRVTSQCQCPCYVCQHFRLAARADLAS